MKTRYTVSKCRKDDSLFGPVHGSDDSENTICGQEIDHHWWIVNNTYDGGITCKKCDKTLDEIVRRGWDKFKMGGN